ncbi:MAG: hypothetical protein RLY30_544 [Pseudomonadota bacterium]|jgi:hypothetical protein
MGGEIRPALRAVEKAGGKAIASLCLLAEVSEEEFRAVLSAARSSDEYPPELRQVEAKLARALGLEERLASTHPHTQLARAHWPETPLRDLQILNGVDSIESTRRSAPGAPQWVLYASLFLYLMLCLAYALGLHDYL